MLYRARRLVTAHERRHIASRQFNGERRRLRRWQCGQTLVIFALSLRVLLGLAGLTIDVARAYDLYARMQRAAEAGALAGVLYMPNFYDQAVPAGVGSSPDSAASRASQEIVKNGFGTTLDPTPKTNPCLASNEVAICRVPGKSDDLRVTITETLDLALLSGLGVQPVTLSATAQAEYLPSIQLGSRLNYFSDQVECYQNQGNDLKNTKSCKKDDNKQQHLQYFMASVRGPATLKEFGDPMVYCEEGPSGFLGVNSTRNTTYNGVLTNHSQWESDTAYGTQGTADGAAAHCGQPGSNGNPGNQDQQPQGYDGPATQNMAHPGGYNYEIVVPNGITNGSVSVWVYNPSFIPSDNLAGPNGNSPLDFLDYSLKGQEPYKLAHGLQPIKYDGSHLDAPPFYFATTYSIYKVPNLYDRSTDLQAPGNPPVTYPTYDGYSFDTPAHGCGGALPAYDPYWAGSSTPNSYNGDIVAGQGCVDLASNTLPDWAKANYAHIYPTETLGTPCYMMWCQLTTRGLSAGTYRLVVEVAGLPTRTAAYTSDTTSGAGNHSYALKVCVGLHGNGDSPIGCSDGLGQNQRGVSIFGWNNAEMDFSSPLAKTPPNPNYPATTCASPALASSYNYTCMDLGCIPTAYAEHTINANLFDPGDGSGNIYIGIVPPQGSDASVTYPKWVATPNDNSSPPEITLGGQQVIHAGYEGYNILNGLWLETQITLNSGYTGNCETGPGGTGWWQLIYATDDNAQPFDWLNEQFSLAGSPVHLVVPS